MQWENLHYACSVAQWFQNYSSVAFKYAYYDDLKTYLLNIVSIPTLKRLFKILLVAKNSSQESKYFVDFWISWFVSQKLVGNAFKQSCSIQNNIGVISSKFINKFVWKCHCCHTLSDQSIPLVTVTSVVSLLTEQLWLLSKLFYPE